MKDYDDIIEPMLEAIILCMDYPMSKITDDDEYSDAVDLQNELKDILNELKNG
jgi:hypothetical protein